MKSPLRGRISLAVAILAIVPLLLSGMAYAAECITLPTRNRPVHCICGAVFDISGERISHAKVSVLRGETEVTSKRTGADGKFSFDGIEAGTYEVRVEASGFHTATSSVVLLQPAGKCKLALDVKLGFGFECDTGIAQVKSKHIR